MSSIIASTMRLLARPPTFAAAVDPFGPGLLRVDLPQPCRHGAPAGPAFRRGQTILRIDQYSDTYSVNCFRASRRARRGVRMKKRWVALGVLAPGGLPADIGRSRRINIAFPAFFRTGATRCSRDRAVTWQPGPANAPAGSARGKRPPNIILIVADDLGYNDISLNGGGVAGVSSRRRISTRSRARASTSPPPMPQARPARHRARR